MDEPHRRRGTVRINLVVARLDRLHIRLANLGIVQRCGPVRATLEDGKLLRLLGDLRDCLDGSGPGADDTDTLASEVHRCVWPTCRVIRRATEALHASDSGHCMGG